MGVNHINGMVRGFLSRIQFRKVFQLVYRPFKVKVHDVNNVLLAHYESGRGAEASVIVTVLKSDDVVEVGSMEKQLFRHDTAGEKMGLPVLNVHGETVVKDVKWSPPASMVVPSTTCQVVAYFTLVCYAKSQNEQEGGEREFLGQASLDINDALLYSRRTLKTLRLGYLENEPQDRGNQKQSRLQNPWRRASGEATVEIVPCSNVTSCCGYMDEVDEHRRLAPKKKWWVVLVDGVLMIQLRPADQKTKYHIKMKELQVKYHKSSGVIDLKGLDFNMALTCTDVHDRKRWWAKMSAACGSPIANYDVRQVSPGVFKRADQVPDPDEDVEGQGDANPEEEEADDGQEADDAGASQDAGPDV